MCDAFQPSLNPIKLDSGLPERIPDADSVVKYLSFKQSPTDPETGIRMAIPQAFRRREGEEFLSCAWLEFYVPAGADLMKNCADGFKNALTVRKSGAFAVGNVLAVRDAGNQFGPRPRIVHEPEDDHQAHAAVRQMNDQNDDLLLLLAMEAWGKLIPAEDLI